ncbi:hypothetical protein CDL15_Pgr018169 [Punica granatum]|uniref:Endonuclease/exonuclease/phosphatase domain-containing protein n=1 Tax=Punica granatum TaxID=22663 RepID=A0A218WHG1_PUNGR|nr:hypothetical protein CDL15_Pgr018169 [Punica granatum]
MSTNPSPVVPKFISVEARDIHSRSQPDGIAITLLLLLHWRVSFLLLAKLGVLMEFVALGAKTCELIQFLNVGFHTGFRFRLVSYNVLAQEVDEYDGFYRANMENSGYTGIYIQRSGQKRDGCGIFYKQDRAELVLEERIEYNDLVDMIQESTDSSDNCNDEPGNGNEDVETKPDSPTKKSTEDRGDPNDPRVRLKRDCVGIMAAFRLKDSSGRLIIVANTHLYWDPEWADVKLAQAKYLLSRLARFRTSVSDKFEAVPPVIVAGDFNSTPGDKVYQYLVSGDSSSFVPKCLDELPIPLRSVYGSTRGEPPFTNCTPSFTDTLDYIFFSPSLYLKPVSFLELPSPDSPDVSGGLPNNYHPSDHLPIGTEFEIAP